MKKIICLAAALLLLALALTGCHKHVSAAPATCTEPEICTECGKVFFVPLNEIKEENELYTCPHCHKPVDFTPLGPDNVPIAKPYRE